MQQEQSEQQKINDEYLKKLEKKKEEIQNQKDLIEQIKLFLNDIPYRTRDDGVLIKYSQFLLELLKKFPLQQLNELVNGLNEQQIINFSEYINKLMEYISNGSKDVRPNQNQLLKINQIIFEQWGSIILLNRISSKKSLVNKKR